MERYRKIYHVLEQFVNNEYQGKTIKDLDILNIENNQKKKKESVSWQSTIEIQFCFHSIPEYIGLIKDKYIDLLCFKKENILVNDDDHEDLIRVCNLFNLFKLSDQDGKSKESV